jgi:hypothetical protein
MEMDLAAEKAQLIEDITIASSKQQLRQILLQQIQPTSFSEAVRDGVQRACLAVSCVCFALFALLLALTALASEEAAMNDSCSNLRATDVLPYWFKHFAVGLLILFAGAATFPIATYFIEGCWIAGLFCGMNFYIGKEIGDWDKITKCFDLNSSLGCEAARFYRTGELPAPGSGSGFDWPGFLAPTIGLPLAALAAGLTQKWHHRSKRRRVRVLSTSMA